MKFWTLNLRSSLSLWNYCKPGPWAHDYDRFLNEDVFYDSRTMVYLSYVFPYKVDFKPTAFGSWVILEPCLGHTPFAIHANELYELP